MVKDFVIPLNKDELLTSHADQYFVDEIVPLRTLQREIDASKAALQEKGVNFILDHFDIFFSVMTHGNKVELPVIMRAFTRIMKAVDILVEDMERQFDNEKDITEDRRPTYLCVNKMLAYLFSWFISHISERVLKGSSDSDIGKRKKSTKSDLEEEWESTRQKALELVYRWFQMPLQKIWQPPVVEESFISTLAQTCYKVLEQFKDKDVKQKHLRQTIFEILGTLVKRYNHGITCVVRLIQLVKLYDTLASNLAIGVVYMVTDCGCKGLIKEVVKEIGRSEPGEMDSRNISIFLESIAITEPTLLIPLLSDITDYLANEYYTMRNCAIGVLGEVVQKALTSEDLTEQQKEQRDECLDNLEEHILDSHAYVRSKVLQVWQRLCCEGAVPLARQGRILAATALRLEDKSAIVRRHALQLLRALLQSNPFAAKLNRDELEMSLEKEKLKLKELQTQVASKSARGDKERLELWNTLLPKIRETLQQVIENKQNKETEVTLDKDGENIDPDAAFENVRQLLLNEKVLEAVTYLWKVCTKLKDAPDIENLSAEAKEECLFLFLLKIFMESEHSKEQQPREEYATDSAHKKKKEEIKSLKRVINYLKNCLEFAIELENSIPMAETLLFSTTAGDAVEACTLLGIAHQFRVIGAAPAIRKALFQVFHRDQSVRNNIASVYKQIYLNSNENQGSERQKAVMRVNDVIDLLKELLPGQSPALARLIETWYNNHDVTTEMLQVLWEKFSLKLPDTSPEESRSALMLITMIAEGKTGIIIDNLDVLIKVGLGPRAKTDLLLARDTCRALLKIKQDNIDIEKPLLRYPNDHDMFKEIIALLTDNFTNEMEDGYVSFATDAINVVYHLANKPDHLMKQLLLTVVENGHFINKEIDQPSTVSFFLLSKFLYLIGHIAIRQMVHLDTAIFKELKRRNAVRELKKGKKSNITKQNSRKSHIMSINSSNSAVQILRSKEASVVQDDNGEEALEGAADDADAEFINSTLENEIVNGDGLLANFVPLVLEVCQYPEKYNNENLQASAVLALSKMMTVSSIFCEQSLQLLVTILERSPYAGIRANVLIGLSDLTTRFPNEVEPWTKHIYGRLRDEDTHVRGTCVRMLSNLIMREMIRVKGQVSELALCIVDQNIQIRQDTRQFFEELSHKGNALYNVMPDILSRLADPELNLDENNFQQILRYILGLMQKERQIDTIIEKICARFKLATTERQWRDLSYCLSLLQFNAKSIRRLIESLPLLKDKIHHKEVLKSLYSIIEQTKKKPEAKAACIELEEKVKELLEGTENTDNIENTELTDSQAMPPPPPPSRKKHVRRAKHKSSSEEEDDDYDSDNESDMNAEAKTRPNKNKLYKSKNNSSSDSDSDDDVSAAFKTGTSGKKIVKNRKKIHDSVGATPSPLPKKSRSGKTPQRTPSRSSAHKLR